MPKHVFLIAPLLVMSATAQASIIDTMSSPFFQPCLELVRVVNGYADLEPGWKKHLKDWSHRGAITQCVRNKEAQGGKI